MRSRWKFFVLEFSLLTLAVVFGFTFLTLLYHSSPLKTQGRYIVQSLRNGSTFPPLLLPPLNQGLVEWRLYGDMETEDLSEDNLGLNEDQYISEAMLNPFQSVLLGGIPLNCYHGSQPSLSTKYERFLQTLNEYTKYHNSLGKRSPARTLVWQCSGFCGGLGDRIRGITYTLLLAMFSRRKLIIFWEDKPEGKLLLPHMVNWKNDVIYESIRNSKSFHVFEFHVVMTKSGAIVNDVSEQNIEYYLKTIGGNETNIVISTNLEPSSLLNEHQNGRQDWIGAGLQWSGLSHLQPSELDDLVGVSFRYLFKLNVEVLVGMQLASEVLGLHVFPYTALHIRTGFAGNKQYEELVQHPKLQHSDTEWDSALACAVFTADRLVGKGSLVFLATDSLLVKYMALTKYGSRIRTLNNTLIHVDKLGKTSHFSDAIEREGVMVLWVEFLLLAQAKVQVRGESGYPWTAGLLCGLHGSWVVNSTNCT